MMNLSKIVILQIKKEVLESKHARVTIYEYDTVALMFEEMAEESYYTGITYLCSSFATYHPTIWDKKKGLVSRIFNDKTGEYVLVSVNEKNY